MQINPVTMDASLEPSVNVSGAKTDNKPNEKFVRRI